MSKAIRRSFSIISCLYVDLYDMILCVHVPVVPHKAVAEVSKIGNL